MGATGLAWIWREVDESTWATESERMRPALPPVDRVVGSYVHHGTFWRRNWVFELERYWAMILVPGHVPRRR